MIKQPNSLDLSKVKNVIFSNTDRLLESFNLEYETLGDNIFLRCPIHEESDNDRALSISLDKMAWRCWTRGCHETYNTDIFGFVRGLLSKDEEATFSDALRYICKIYNINSQNSLQKESDNVNVNNEFSNIVKIFKGQKQEPLQDIETNIITCGESKYFMSRGFNKETLKYFNVEDCIDKASPMVHRSIIPVHCDNGKKIAYIARATRDYIVPKYLFSKNFKKSEYLYNFHRAVSKARNLSSMFIVEGQGDVWRMYESGINNCVSLFGKDISQPQKTKLLCSGITTLIILTDNDQAGRESKIKIQRNLNLMFNLKFPKMSRKDIGAMSVQKIQEDILPQTKGLY